MTSTTAAGSARPARTPPSLSTLAHWTVLALLVLLVFGPILALVLATLAELTTGHRDWLALAFPRGRQLPLLWRTLVLAVSVAVSGMVAGVLVASVLTRWRTGRRSTLRWGLLVLAPVPLYVHALAWSSAVLTVNRWLAAQGLPEVTLRGIPAAWWIELMAFLPVAAGIALVALEAVPTGLIEAARPLRPDIHVFRQVVLPLAKPMLLAGGSILLLLSLLDYSVPALFRENVYSLAVFAEYSIRHSAVRTFLFSVPLLVLMMAVVVASQAALRDVAQEPGRPKRPPGLPFRWPGWFRALQVLACALLAVQILVPVVVLLIVAQSWSVFVQTVTAAGEQISFSILIALAAALACLPLALGLADQLQIKDRFLRWRWFFVTSPLAIPAPLIGVGLILIWNRPLVGGVYSSAVMPVLAALARFTSLAAIIVLAQMRRIDPTLIDAARILQSSSRQTWLQVRLPMLMPGLVAAASLTFALTLGEIGATLLVAPPGRSTITLRIYNFLHSGESEAVAGLCLMMAVIAALAGLVAAVTLHSWSRVLPDSQVEEGSA
jgi:iron(III) transport system permease protein